jgi:hypothetical protein
MQGCFFFDALCDIQAEKQLAENWNRRKKERTVMPADNSIGGCVNTMQCARKEQHRSYLLTSCEYVLCTKKQDLIAALLF